MRLPTTEKENGELAMLPSCSIYKAPLMLSLFHETSGIPAFWEDRNTSQSLRHPSEWIRLIYFGYMKTIKIDHSAVDLLGNVIYLNS